MLTIGVAAITIVVVTSALNKLSIAAGRPAFLKLTTKSITM